MKWNCGKGESQYRIDIVVCVINEHRKKSIIEENYIIEGDLYRE